MIYGENVQYVMEDVADLACSYATTKGYGLFKTLKGGRNCFYPVIRDDEVGVGVNHEYHYLVYQERGFASYPMKALYGKTIPMLINGQIVFRKCTGINQFRSGHKNYWQRDSSGELIPVWRQRRAWVHPGLGPKNFMADAVKEAVSDSQEDIDLAFVMDAMGDIEDDLERMGRWRI